MKSLITLWKFSRPHTVIGSVISIFTLYFIVCQNKQTQSLTYLLLALSIGITCNIFIVGINQIADVNIDRINKPFLPIPSGELSVRQAKTIVVTALFLSLGMALFITPYLFAIITLAATIGWAYSMPPLHLKRHHITAALAITIVRGVILNLGGFLVFNYLVNGSLTIPENVKILTLFIIAFSIVISWFKDLPDIEGDKKYDIKSFVILYSPKAALIAGHLLVGLAYLFTIYLKSTDYLYEEDRTFETQILLFGHIILLTLFIANAFSIEHKLHSSVSKFYKRFWWFFFAEYALYLIAYV